MSHFTSGFMSIDNFLLGRNYLVIFILVSTFYFIFRIFFFFFFFFFSYFYFCFFFCLFFFFFFLFVFFIFFFLFFFFFFFSIVQNSVSGFLVPFYRIFWYVYLMQASDFLDRFRPFLSTFSLLFVCTYLSFREVFSTSPFLFICSFIL